MLPRLPWRRVFFFFALGSKQCFVGAAVAPPAPAAAQTYKTVVCFVPVVRDVYRLVRWIITGETEEDRKRTRGCAPEMIGYLLIEQQHAKWM